MRTLESIGRDICYSDRCVTSDKCLLATPLHIFQSYLERNVCEPKIVKDDLSNTYYLALKTLRDSLGMLPVIMTTLLGIIVSQLLCQHLPMHSCLRFLLEFLFIAFPTVLINTVASDYKEVIFALSVVLIVLLLRNSGTWHRAITAAPVHCYEVGRKPSVITVIRCTTYVCTGCVILAVDFKSFPKEWRKNRTFGASLMDVGIGMFVLTMGVVSHRTQHFAGMKRVLQSVVPLLVLGLARTVVITVIGYHQDELEYGRHLNAFFTLGFTKLLGSLCSLLTRSDNQLLPLALAILGLHELALQLGLSEYVMSDAKRHNFVSANREGLSALPGCVALYLLSMWGGKWYRSADKLNHTQFVKKLLQIVCFNIVVWTLIAFCTLAFGIARVTFNAGYVFWMLGLGGFLLLVNSFLFEFCFMLPNANGGDHLEGMPASLPAFAEIINMNGLTYFILSNLLTGFVNMTLEPAKRSNVECVTILMLYMLATCGMLYILFRKGIRIA